MNSPHGAMSAAAELEIELPSDAGDVDQDQEWCDVVVDGERRRIRFHDYDEIYAIPGLYERLFYDELECDSPRTVRTLLQEHLAEEGREPEDLRVLDVGAGNGMVGEQLADMGATEIVGIDIIEEAAHAAARDRAGVYDDYVIADLTDPPAGVLDELESRRFNCMTTVAALGFGDIPPEAFAQAYNLVEQRGLIGFSIKADMIGGGDRSGFADLIDRALGEGAMELKKTRRYRHRLTVAGDPVFYVAMVAEKAADLEI